MSPQPRETSASPTRLDPLVWAVSDLLIASLPNAGIFDLYRAAAARLRTPAVP